MALGAALVWAGCGGSDPTTTTASEASAESYDGATANPVRPAPPLELDNYRGQPVDLKDYRGKAVFLTFIYVNCPDVCPVIVSNMRAAQEELGPEAKDVEFMAVSVDPENDTPKAVAEFLKERQMEGRMQYLVGSRSQLEKVWESWMIVARENPSKKYPDYVEHAAPIYGISASGDLTTLYPANFKPQQLVHDAPILASQ